MELDEIYKILREVTKMMVKGNKQESKEFCKNIREENRSYCKLYLDYVESLF